MPRKLPDNPSEVLAQAADIMISLSARVSQLEDELNAIKQAQKTSRMATADEVAALKSAVDNDIRRKLDNPHILTKSLILRYMADHGMLNE
jgi:hypothetical protein